jgi:AmmeMemoRadiSam system protein B
MKNPRIILLLSALLLLFSTGCSRTEVSGYDILTWEKRGETFPLLPLPPAESLLEEDDFPIGGIVSHHLLAGAMIDDWFRRLKAARGVETFFILSPRHWDLGVESYSLGDLVWSTAGGTVSSDSAVVAELCAALGVTPEPEVFTYEHGVSALVPFIGKYFPSSRVVAVAYAGEAPVNTYQSRILWEAVAPAFTGDSIGDNFLLISADFAHHGDLETTKMKDLRTRRFLYNPGMDTWIFAGCDNRPGIFLLAALSGELSQPEISILYHSNSFALSGQGAEDITSYFFTFLHETGVGEKE